MTTWLTQWGSVFVTLVVILDPPGAVPIFLAVTAPLTPRQRVAAARRASLVAFGLIAAFAVFGQQIRKCNIIWQLVNHHDGRHLVGGARVLSPH